MTGRPHHRGDHPSIYRCHHYTTGGRGACFSNTIHERDLLDCVVRKLRMEFLADQAIKQLLVAYRKRLAARRKAVPADDGRLRKQIEALDRQIDQGAERVLSAPENLVATLYRKLDQLRVERDRLQAQLDTTGRPETGSSAQDDKKVEEAARVLRDMRAAFKDAKPEEVRQLLQGILVKVEVRFEHEQDSRRTVNTPTGGVIVVRPPAESSILFASLGS